MRGVLLTTIKPGPTATVTLDAINAKINAMAGYSAYGQWERPHGGQTDRDVVVGAHATGEGGRGPGPSINSYEVRSSYVLRPGYALSIECFSQTPIPEWGGKTIDPDAVAAFAAPAALVIAHNAAFDRKFLERFSDVFSAKTWACSMSEVDWAGEGFEGVKLAYLAAGAGFFYERHRAAQDCLAAIELLARRHPASGRAGLH